MVLTLRVVAWMVWVAVLLMGPGASSAVAAQPTGAQLELITRGNTAFRHGQFAEALSLYQQARVHGETPELVFNLAQCHRKLGQTRDAVRLFRTYLARYPDAPNRAVVERVLARLGANPEEDALDARQSGRPAPGSQVLTAPAAGSGATESDSAAARPWYRRWYVWTAIGAAVVAGAVVGGVVGSRSGSSAPPSSTFGHREFFPLWSRSP